MKLRKLIMTLILIVLGTVTTFVNAESSIPSYFYLSGSDLYPISNSKYVNGANYTLYYKKTTGGKIVYCIQRHKAAVTSGSVKYTYSNEYNSKYVYVLENGYPNKSITGNNEKDYYITGIAIWYLSNPSDSIFNKFNFSSGTYNGYSSDVAKEVGKLISGANNYTQTKPTMTMSAPSANLTLSSNKDYYVSSEMSVSKSENSGTYTVSLENAPSGAFVADANGNKKTTFDVSEKFYVKVPASSVTSSVSGIKVNVSSTGTINTAHAYYPSNSAYQAVVALYPKTINQSAATSLNINVSYKVTISKLDIANDQELPGAHLVVKDTTGKIIDEWTSTTTPHVIENIPVGTYTLTETIAPDGYKLNEETTTFKIESGKLETSIAMYNSKKEVTKVSISKQDATTSSELPGAHLVVKDDKGNIVDEWVSGDKPHLITGLEANKKYTLTETIAPDGYKLNEETIEFSVNEDGTMSTVVMYNAPNEVIKYVPKTSSYKKVIYSLIGIIIIGLGSFGIYKNYKENE